MRYNPHFQGELEGHPYGYLGDVGSPGPVASLLKLAVFGLAVYGGYKLLKKR